MGYRGRWIRVWEVEGISVYGGSGYRGMSVQVGR